MVQSNALEVQSRRLASLFFANGLLMRLNFATFASNRKIGAPTVLDAFDRKLLNLMQTDTRRTAHELSEAVGL
ncbi:MAG: AsnC family protein, partial [Rhizobiaceae bacterium]|nr:AsnC family protein [Rhizobiaceae bacterium]